MENAVEALKMAFSVMMFVLALTLSISCFSKANTAVTAITNMRDRETEYTYVEPTRTNRIVGVDEVIPTMYRAYIEHFEVRFYDVDGKKELPIYYATDYQNQKYGERQKDEDDNYITINYVDLVKEKFGTEINPKTGGNIPPEQVAIKHLDIIMGKRPEKKPEEPLPPYYNQFYEDGEDGFYERFKNSKFEEQLGEYYLETTDETTGGTKKTKKRVITYILQ